MGFYEPHYVVLKIKNHIVWFFGTHAPMKGGLGDLIGYQLCQLVLKRRLDLASCYPVLYELLSSVSFGDPICFAIYTQLQYRTA